MPPRTVALARDPRVAEAAASVMPKGNAADAIVAGVLAACAASPVVFLGPLQVIVAGPGIGVRGVDGRSRQPGLGVARPRGFVSSEPIPEAAHVAAPGLPAALVALSASFGTLALKKVGAPAIAFAPSERRAVLGHYVERGPAALLLPDVESELISASGRFAGGVLTRDDLDRVVPRVTARALEGKGARSVAWASDPDEDCDQSFRTDVLVVADSRGAVAAACFASSETDPCVIVASLGLSAPRLAHPVRRGVRRTAPGVSLPTFAPLAVASTGLSGERIVDLALAAEGADARRTLRAALLHFEASGELPEHADAGSLFAASVAGKTASGIVRKAG